MRFVKCVAAAWLFVQLSILAAPPMSLLAAGQTANGPACTCSHTGHDQCPMHHPSASDPEKSSPKRQRGCECRSTTQPGDATLVSLLGPIAVMPHTTAAVADLPTTGLSSHPISTFSVVVAAPDGPPPRA